MVRPRQLLFGLGAEENKQKRPAAARLSANKQAAGIANCDGEYSRRMGGLPAGFRGILSWTYASAVGSVYGHHTYTTTPTISRSWMQKDVVAILVLVQGRRCTERTALSDYEGCFEALISFCYFVLPRLVLIYSRPFIPQSVCRGLLGRLWLSREGGCRCCIVISSATQR